MKLKKSLMLFAICFAFISLLSFNACTPKGTGGTITVIILNQSSAAIFEKEFTTGQTTLYKALGECEELEISATFSFAGAFLNGIAVRTVEEGAGGIYYFNKTAEMRAAGNSFIAVYHDIDDIKYKDSYMSDLIYNSKTYFASGWGVSSLPVYNGVTYILRLESL